MLSKVSHLAEQIHSSTTGNPLLLWVGGGVGIWVGFDISLFSTLGDNFMPARLSDRPGVAGGGISCLFVALSPKLLVPKPLFWLFPAKALLTLGSISKPVSMMVTWLTSSEAIQDISMLASSRLSYAMSLTILVTCLHT
jgi:hypothetical protein